MLRAEIEADCADVAERQSLRWLWHEIEYGGDLFGDLPVDGYRAFVDALVPGLDVRLGFEVACVESVGDGVRVVGADRSVETGSHVIVTVPLGVLKRGVPEFRPALAADRLDAIEQLGFGRYEKIALAFDAPFWREAGLSHLIALPAEPGSPAVWFFDLDDFGAGAALVAHLFASNTGWALDVSEDEAVSWGAALLAGALGRPCPPPAAVWVTSWGCQLLPLGRTRCAFRCVLASLVVARR
jgi:hypothetical protein